MTYYHVDFIQEYAYSARIPACSKEEATQLMRERVRDKEIEPTVSDVELSAYRSKEAA